MRKISEIIIHCSATIEGRDYTVAEIELWHRQRGFSGIGYHYVIYRDGSIHAGRYLELAGAHCQGHNAHSIGICYIGGLSEECLPKDTRTPAQKAALRTLVAQLQERFSYPAPDGTLIVPSVHGHNEFCDKDCPCFRVPEEL